ncbi:fimbria/pilus outer membrane usher protein [Novosphingobium pentaromativorans]|uniref:Fimbrial biogenesis outer membrane usher protein n=1 Tax=Novosphingobium pentaromativorans US6-1 TaxID=1088721 RepID=G6EKM7_9SPHN|nr:fimbria/pilus outer membrane usher protein [Novosphingobium pentaromativorans]AIT82819.1 hypothetical protein JI59_25615 [Novosphingobium pentaromativorans US6-1]EHJ58148.1 hypothetical protein NSU_4898 [Novosphingobium pentaromativorans US6-1]
MRGRKIALGLLVSSYAMAVSGAALAQDGTTSAKAPERPQDARAADIPAPRPASRAMAFTVPLVSGTKVLGDVLIEVAKDGGVRIDSQTLRSELDKLLNDTGHVRLDEAIAGRPYVAATDLKSMGVDLAFDSSRLELQVSSIEGSIRRVETLGEAGENRARIDLPVIAPAGFSSYLNLVSNVDYLSDTGFANPDVFLTGATRVADLVLEYDGAFTDQFGEGYSFYRRSTRAVYDQPDKYRRFSAGDLRLNTMTLLRTPFLGGIAVEKSRQIFDPFLPAARLGGREIFLDNSSTVDVIINGQKYQSFQLQSGTYDLASLPVQLGSNDVQLQIRDSFGRQQTVNLDYFFEPLDLAPGDEEYSFALGMIASNLTFEPDYGKDPAFTGFYRKALSRNVILGGAVQASERVQLLGGTASFVPQVIPGAFDIEAAVSRGNNGTGYALRANYRYRSGSSLTHSSQLSVNVDFESRNFDTIGDIVPNDFNLLNVGVNYTQGFTDRTYASIGVIHTRRGGGLSNRTTVFGDVIHRLTDRIRLTAGVEYGDSEFYSSNFGVRLALSFALGGGVRANADYRSRTETFRSTVSKGNDSTVGSIGYDLGFTDTRGETSADGSLDYIGNRFDARASLFTQGSDIGHLADQQRARLQVGTSIAYAGGSFGVGRPIGDSFALVKPHETLKDNAVITSRSLTGAEYYARSGILGAALQGDLSSYNGQDIQYDVDSLQPGYDIGDGTVRVDPPYRSGYRITVGNDHFVSAVGTLVSNGEPVSLISGTVRADDPDEDFQPLPFFTNSAGRFGLIGLAPGKSYTVTLNGKQGPFVINVPKDNSGLYRLDMVDLRQAGE